VQRAATASAPPATDGPLSAIPSPDGLLRTTDGQVWIPSHADDLHLRICIVAHTGLGGHRGTQTTLETISSKFYWETLADDVRSFCRTCLHCVSTLGGESAPRPWGEALHADKPNELLHMDYLYMGLSSTQKLYILLLKDDLSGYLWLVPCSKADAVTTVDALVDWFTTFGVVRTWVSDQGAHFKNQTASGRPCAANTISQQPTPRGQMVR
jgi:hypothetical protein